MKLTHSLILSFLFFVCLPFFINTRIYAREVYIEDGVLKIVNGFDDYLYTIDVTYNTDRFVILNDNPNSIVGGAGCNAAVFLFFAFKVECVIPQEDITEIYIEAKGYSDSTYSTETLNIPVTFYVPEAEPFDLTAGSSDEDTLILDANVGWVQFLMPTVEIGAADMTIGNFENTIIYGTGGNDSLLARYFPGTTTIYGGIGDDTIIGSDGNNDLLVPGSGNDYVDGYGGALDTLGIHAAGDVVITPGINIIGEGNDLIYDIAIIEVNGSDDPNIIDASDSPVSVVISSGGGSDTIYTSDIDSVNNEVDMGEDNDSVYLGTGNVTIDGGDGNDTLFATYNADMDLTDSTLTISGIVTANISDMEATQLTGGVGDNEIDASTATLNNVINTLGGDDTVLIGDGEDIVNTSTGHDEVITSGGGADTITTSGDSDGDEILFELDNADNIVDIRTDDPNIVVQVDGVDTTIIDSSLVNINTNNGNDTVSSVFQNIAEITVDGGAHTTTDRVFFDVELQDYSHEIVSTTSGALDLALKEPFNYVNIESLTILNARRNGGGGGSSRATNVASFADIDGHTLEEYITNLFDDDIVAGYSDGLFHPDNYVTRSQMAKFLILAFDLPINDQGNGFSDLDSANVLNKYVVTLKNLGISNGYADGTFGPERGITRGEASKLLVLALKAKGIEVVLDSGETIAFADVPKNYLFVKEILMLMKLKSGDNYIVNGYSDGLFRPENYITRAEMAKIIDLARNV